MYRTSDYDYYLPPGQIAQFPADRRDSSRLLVLDRSTGEIRDRKFSDIADHLTSNDLLVVNNVKVDPVRLFGNKDNASGRIVEIFLLKKAANGSYEALIKPAKKVPPGSKILLGENDHILVEAVDHNTGHRFVRFEDEDQENVMIEKYGQIPIPPYIKNYQQEFKERYQTVYAKHKGASAAPTAGMHFTSELLHKIKSKGVQLIELTLFVGVGTFQPVRTGDIRDHKMHSEKYAIDPDSWQQILEAKSKGKKIVCVGTTTVRTLESVVRSNLLAGETDIFIYPGFKFQVVDKLITNFHLPGSSLMMLVSAFAGYENIMAAYRHAVEGEYRFFSFGDAMFIE